MFLVKFCDYNLYYFFAPLIFHLKSERIGSHFRPVAEGDFWKRSISLLSHKIILGKQFPFRESVCLFSDTLSPLISKALMDLRAFPVH